MKDVLSYVAGAVIAAGVVAMLEGFNRQAAIMLALITVLLVVIAKQDAVKRVASEMGIK